PHHVGSLLIDVCLGVLGGLHRIRWATAIYCLCRACFFCRGGVETPKTGMVRMDWEVRGMPVARPLPAVLLLLVVGGVAGGQTAAPADSPAPVVDDLTGVWPRIWGVAGLSGYPYGHKMAPNGEAYQPIFDLDLLLNVALTKDRSLYVFSKGH